MVKNCDLSHIFNWSVLQLKIKDLYMLSFHPDHALIRHFF
jgi:hypothetical protein